MFNLLFFFLLQDARTKDSVTITLSLWWQINRVWIVPVNEDLSLVTCASVQQSNLLKVMTLASCWKKKATAVQPSNAHHMLTLLMIHITRLHLLLSRRTHLLTHRLLRLPNTRNHLSTRHTEAVVTAARHQVQAPPLLLLLPLVRLQPPALLLHLSMWWHLLRQLTLLSPINQHIILLMLTRDALSHLLTLRIINCIQWSWKNNILLTLHLRHRTNKRQLIGHLTLLDRLFRLLSLHSGHLFVLTSIKLPPDHSDLTPPTLHPPLLPLLTLLHLRTIDDRWTITLTKHTLLITRQRNADPSTPRSLPLQLLHLPMWTQCDSPTSIDDLYHPLLRLRSLP